MHELPLKRLSISLLWKLLFAFSLVVAVSVITVSWLANRAADREVRQYLQHGGLSAESQMAEQLAAYYQGRQSWDAVGAWFSAQDDSFPKGDGKGRGQGAGSPAQADWILLDAEQQVVFGLEDEQGTSLSAAEFESATIIQVEGEIVGYVMRGPSSTSIPGQELLERVNHSIWISALIAGLAAIAIGCLFALAFIRPIRELTRASRMLEQGDLGQRVQVRSGDELGALSATFNQMAESLERAGEMRREMTADIAHELRNPLAIMQARIEAMLDQVYPLTQENLAPVLQQVQLLNRLVEDLRTLALADAGNLTLERVPVNVAAFVRKGVEPYAIQSEQQAIELIVDVECEDCWVLMDPLRMQQVLNNLLGNAIRHTPQGGWIQLKLEGKTAGGMARLRVMDSGDGIPSESIELVFSRFHRADRGRDRRSGGTGLGLAIARKLVEAHGGRIWATNHAQGGAEFILELALIDAPDGRS